MKIGLEIHVAMSNVKSKLFCSCANKVFQKPNINCCEICTGMPGSKPLVNEEAIKTGIKIGLALNCKINKEIFFSRKSYFYNDLPKNFQITQYEIPIGENGYIIVDGKKIRIRRLHIEEDPGKIIHIGAGITNAEYTLIDYNRSGIPLCEIVTEPDITSPEEAKRFLEILVSILEYLEVYDEKREGALRVDTNLSISDERVEIKNITGFKSVEDALKYEIKRHKKEQIKRETRMWDENAKITKPLRTKEEEEEYGYIFEPDLTPIKICEKLLKEIKESLPEMPWDKVKRYKNMGLKEDVAKAIANDVKLARFFENVIKDVDAHIVAKFFADKLLKTLNYNQMKINETKLTVEKIKLITKALENKQLTERAAEMILREAVVKELDIKKAIENKLLMNEEEIKKVVLKVIKEYKKAVEDLKSGKKQALNYLVGKVMSITKAKAEPNTVRKLIQKML